jgi:hypothetical protein
MYICKYIYIHIYIYIYIYICIYIYIYIYGRLEIREVMADHEAEAVDPDERVVTALVASLELASRSSEALPAPRATAAPCIMGANSGGGGGGVAGDDEESPDSSSSPSESESAAASSELVSEAVRNG